MAYQHILVPVDGSEISFSAVRHAAKIAKAFGSQLSLISLIAEDPFTEADFYYSSSIMKEYFIEAHANAKKALKEATAIAAGEGIEAQSRIVTGLVNAEHIAETAGEVKADLIVMGSHGRKGFQKMILGSFAPDVLSASEIPVLIVKKESCRCASSRCAVVATFTFENLSQHAVEIYSLKPHSPFAAIINMRKHHE